jgi:DNA gyrase subunit B
MPELVERGHLFIAQPPLYKVAKGKSEAYLKDQSALEDYLVGSGLEGTVLQLANGEQRAGNDLADIVAQARRFQRIMDGLHSRYSRVVVEQAAIGGALDAGILADAAAAERLAGEIARRLDAVSDETERGWQGKVHDGDGLVLVRELRGVKEAHAVDKALIGSQEARRLHERHAHLAEIYGAPAKLRVKDTEHIVSGPAALLRAIYDSGRKGLSLQRYKGLGEMNAEQLWETTLDKDSRTLLQVKLGDLTEADEIFAKLMGDVVEPRREFIQENALSASVDA